MQNSSCILSFIICYLFTQLSTLETSWVFVNIHFSPHSYSLCLIGPLSCSLHYKKFLDRITFFLFPLLLVRSSPHHVSVVLPPVLYRPSPLVFPKVNRVGYVKEQLTFWMWDFSRGILRQFINCNFDKMRPTPLVLIFIGLFACMQSHYLKPGTTSFHYIYIVSFMFSYHWSSS